MLHKPSGDQIYVNDFGELEQSSTCLHEPEPNKYSWSMKQAEYE